MAKVTYKVLGENIANIIMDFISSGEFYNAIEILKEAELTKEQIYDFLKGKYTLIGEDDKIEMVETNTISDNLFDGWYSLNNELGIIDKYYNTLLERYYDNKHVSSLKEYIDFKDFKETYKYHFLESEQYNIIKVDEPSPLNTIRDGVILQDGTFIGGRI